MGDCILNLRAPAVSPVVEQWLDTPQAMHSVVWRYNDADQDYLNLSALRQYDGIIFIESTTASRPTANALKTIANRDSF
jgi:erythromycin esterase-like protein